MDSFNSFDHIKVYGVDAPNGNKYRCDRDSDEFEYLDYFKHHTKEKYYRERMI